MINTKWHKRFLKLAAEISTWSKDQSTKVGAVVIGPDREPRGFGFNGFPRKVNDDIPHRHERPAKYKYGEHAERNALYQMTLVGIPAKGCTLYTTHFPCADCARAVIQTGIIEVVIGKTTLTEDFKSRWSEDIKISEELLSEAGVTITIV